MSYDITESIGQYTPSTTAGDNAGYYPTPGGIAEGWHNAPPSPCSRDSHRFECRHEKHCFCGKTARLDVPEGL